MAKLIYNHMKNASTDHTLFELNGGYDPCSFFKDEADLCLKSRSAKKQAKKLKD